MFLQDISRKRHQVYVKRGREQQRERNQNLLNGVTSQHYLTNFIFVGQVGDVKEVLTSV